MTAAPLWRWPGGKRSTAAAIRYAIVRHPRTRYVEPFLGGGSIALGIEGPCLLSDHDAPLMRLWSEVRDHPERLFVAASEVAAGLMHGDGMTTVRYNALRDREALRGRPEDLLVLLGMTFNGLYRRGAFNAINAPWNLKPPTVPSLDRIHAVSWHLAEADLRCASYLDVLADCGRGDVVYLDPPYVGTQGYGRDKPWTAAQFRELLDASEAVADRGGVVVLSHSDIGLPLRWHVDHLDARSSIGATGGRRGTRREIVATLTRERYCPPGGG